MSEASQETSLPDSPNLKNEIVKEDVNLQFHLYVVIFIIIYYGSWLLPAMIFWGYFFFPFRIFFLESANFITIFTDFTSLISLLLMPLVIFGCYLLHLYLVGVITKILWYFTERASPSKSGIIPRNIRSRTANYYHIRSFMIKYGKNSFMKGPFPFLANWFYNFVGSSKIGKKTVMEESVMNDKFVDVGSNCYFGVNSTLASHLLQGVFGNISYFKIKVGDNVTAAAMCQIGPGSEINDDAYLLPFASVSKHSVINTSKKQNYYFGIPMRKIFKRKIMDYLKIEIEDIERNKNYNKIEVKEKTKSKKKRDFIEEVKPIEKTDSKLPSFDETSEKDYAIDFTTSSAISRVNIKFLAVYIPIFWLSGLLVGIFWYWYSNNPGWLAFLLMLPAMLLGMVFLFILACVLFTKLFLIFVNLIHKPKEGIFVAEITRGNRNTDYEFWMLRTELKKLGLWFLRNTSLPWTDAFAFKIFGVKMDYSSHLNDAWCDSDFLKFGRKVLIGQGATIMSSMVVGKYLIIKEVLIDDYAMVGGHTTIAPGTIIGKESVIGAISSTTYNQVLEPGWVYFGFPAIKLKENKYAEERSDVIIKRDVDKAKKFEMIHDVNIDEDKKEEIKSKDNHK